MGKKTNLNYSAPSEGLTGICTSRKQEDIRRKLWGHLQHRPLQQIKLKAVFLKSLFTRGQYFWSSSKTKCSQWGWAKHPGSFQGSDTSQGTALALPGEKPSPSHPTSDRAALGPCHIQQCFPLDTLKTPHRNPSPCQGSHISRQSLSSSKYLKSKQVKINPHCVLSQILIQTTQLAVFIKGKISFSAASGFAAALIWDWFPASFWGASKFPCATPSEGPGEEPNPAPHKPHLTQSLIHHFPAQTLVTNKAWTESKRM